MAKQRLPRSILKLTRYLESVLVDPKSTPSMKSVASGRLTDLFLAASADKARREIAIARADARQAEAAAALAGVGTPETEEQAQGPVSDTAVDVKAYLAQFTGK